MTPFCQDRVDRFLAGNEEITIKRQVPCAESKWSYHWVLFEDGSDKIVYGVGDIYIGDQFDYAYEESITNSEGYWNEDGDHSR